MNKTQTVIASAAIVATVAASGVLGMTAVSAATASTDIVSKAAHILGVDESKLIDAFKQAKIDKINENITNGVVDKSQGLSMIEKIKDSKTLHIIPEVKNNANVRKNKMGFINDLVKFLNITLGDFKAKLKGGSTLKDIANEKGKSEDELKQFINTEKSKIINEGIENQELRNRILKNFDEMVNRLMNHKFNLNQ